MMVLKLVTYRGGQIPLAVAAKQRKIFCMGVSTIRVGGAL
jgi:hypothetical protein